MKKKETPHRKFTTHSNKTAEKHMKQHILLNKTREPQAKSNKKIN